MYFHILIKSAIETIKYQSSIIPNRSFQFDDKFEKKKKSRANFQSGNSTSKNDFVPRFSGRESFFRVKRIFNERARIFDHRLREVNVPFHHFSLDFRRVRDLVDPAKTSSPSF